MYGKFVRGEQVKCGTFTPNAWKLVGLTLPDMLWSFGHPEANISQHYPNNVGDVAPTCCVRLNGA